MNILLINHYAGSPEMGMEYRPYYLAREWINLGHKVTVIAGTYSHIRKQNHPTASDFDTQDLNGVTYVWIKTPTYKGNGIKRLFSMFVFTLKLLFFRKWINKSFSPDLVIASSTYPLDNIPAYYIAKLSQAKYYYEVHDLWPLSPMELGGFSKWHPFILLMQWAENFAYNRVDKVISMLPLTKPYMVSHGLAPEKWKYVPNGIVLDDWHNTERISKEYRVLLSDLKKKGKILVGYTGTIGVANALQSFIKSAELMRDHSVVLIIVGQGPEKSKLEEYVAKNKISNVLFLNAVGKKQIPDLLDCFDMLYIGLKNEPLFRFGISPNKLIDYMMAGKPIIHAITAGNDMVKENACGVSIAPENPIEIVRAINQIQKLSIEEKEMMKSRARNYILANHTYEELAKRMLM